MSNALPTQSELRCGGISLIIAVILLFIAWFLMAIDYDAYSVSTEEEVRKLHDIVSSNKHRIEIEAACACIWLSFPLLLYAIYAIIKLGKVIFEGTHGESLIYIAEKGYIIFIAMVLILIPALNLVSVSYDWSFHESTASDDIVPTGYWVQLYVITFQLELLDCAAIADATFMISYFSATYYLRWTARHGNTRLIKISDAISTGLFRKCKSAENIVSVCCCCSLFIMFLIVLFEFAESGFFSSSGYAGWVFIWSFIAKIFIGIRMIQISKNKKYNELKKAYHAYKPDQPQQELQDLNLTATDNYQMETINVDQQ